MMPPRKTAAQTWRCVRLTGPAHASGETHSAKTMPATHWKRHQAGEQPIGALVDVVLRTASKSSSARRVTVVGDHESSLTR